MVVAAAVDGETGQTRWIWCARARASPSSTPTPVSSSTHEEEEEEEEEAWPLPARNSHTRPCAALWYPISSSSSKQALPLLVWLSLRSTLLCVCGVCVCVCALLP